MENGFFNTCGVPQRSVISLVISNIHMQPLGELLRQHELKGQQYARDTQLHHASAMLSSHTESLTRGCCYHLWLVRRLGPILADDDLAPVIHAFAISHLDLQQCNRSGQEAFSTWEAPTNIEYCSTSPMQHRPLPVLRSLYWLPTEHHIKLKISVFIFKVLSGLRPGVLKNI